MFRFEDGGTERAAVQPAIKYRTQIDKDGVRFQVFDDDEADMEGPKWRTLAEMDADGDIFADFNGAKMIVNAQGRTVLVPSGN